LPQLYPIIINLSITVNYTNYHFYQWYICVTFFNHKIITIIFHSPISPSNLLLLLPTIKIKRRVISQYQLASHRVVILKTAHDPSSILPLIRAIIALSVIASHLSDVSLAISTVQYLTLSLFAIVPPRAFVTFLARSQHILAMQVPLKPLIDLPVIHIAVRVPDFASHQLILLPLTFIHSSIVHGENSPAMFFIIQPQPIVVSFNGLELALALFAIFVPAAFVEYILVVVVTPMAILLAIGPFAFVNDLWFASVEQSVEGA
jgi:hypothetical protein